MKLRPARSQAEGNNDGIRVIADLDTFANESVGVRIKGKIYVLMPVNFGQLMDMEVSRLKLIEMLSARGDGLVLTSDEVYQRYFEFVSPIIPDLKYADIRALNVTALNSLLHLVMRQLAGDQSLYDHSEEKKKFLEMNLVKTPK